MSVIILASWLLVVARKSRRIYSPIMGGWEAKVENPLSIREMEYATKTKHDQRILREWLTIT